MKNKKTMAIGLLCLTLIFMGIGFALFSTTLNLSGTATSSGTFDVKITNYVLDSTKTTAGSTDNTAAITNNYAVTEQNLSATFSEPGDYITWNITVTNRGTIGATITVNTTENANGAYKLKCTVTEGTTLAPSATTTFPCEMSFDKNHELTAQEFAQLPKGTNVTMTVSVTAVQSANYEAPVVLSTNPLVGKTFSGEYIMYESGNYYYGNYVLVRNITPTTLEMFDETTGDYVEQPYTYDETTHICSVNNGMYEMNVIELDSNVIVYNNDIHAFVTSNSNVGTQLITGYSFTSSSTRTFEEYNGHGILVVPGGNSYVYYLIDPDNIENGDVLLFLDSELYTLTKVNGEYTSISDGTNTYNLIPPTP